MSSKYRVMALLVTLLFLGLNAVCYAEDITVVLVGQTHAMLYPCHCPIEPDGGIARRATLVNQIRKSNPNTLLIDSGSFFAGGPMDPGSQGQDLDRSRTLVHLKAMELMKYDAALISADEFNFGRQFLQDNILKSGIPFLSANMALEKTVPYIMKKFGKTKVAVIGLVAPVVGDRSEGVVFSPPEKALKETLGQIAGENPDLVIVVSGLDEEANRRMLSENPKVNILIEGAKFAKEKVYSNAGPQLVMAPRWEGRRIVAATVAVNDKVMEVRKVEDLRISDKLADDKQMLAVLPACYSANDCRKEGFTGSCVNPGKSNAQCQYKAAPKTGLTVITKPDCSTCNTDMVVNSLKREIPGLSVNILNFPGAKAEELISRFGLKYLPAYMLDSSVEKSQIFDKLKENLEPKDGIYLLSVKVAGMGYFLHRHNTPEKLDIFLSLFKKDSGELLDTLKEFEPEVHFLVNEDNGVFTAAGGKMEAEEYLRSVCVQKYYPGFFYNYITCRARNSDSSWWADCIKDFDLKEVNGCARGQEGKDLLRENIRLNRELEIAVGPTYLLDNEQIFSSVKVPNKEEFRKIMNFKR